VNAKKEKIIGHCKHCNFKCADKNPDDFNEQVRIFILMCNHTAAEHPKIFFIKDKLDSRGDIIIE